MVERPPCPSGRRASRRPGRASPDRPSTVSAMAPVMSRTSASRTAAVSAPSILPEPSASSAWIICSVGISAWSSTKCTCHARLGDLDARVLVDREVAERMRLGSRHEGQREHAGRAAGASCRRLPAERRQQPHRIGPVQRMEARVGPCARCSAATASVFSPAQAAIAPRWYARIGSALSSGWPRAPRAAPRGSRPTGRAPSRARRARRPTGRSLTAMRPRRTASARRRGRRRTAPARGRRCRRRRGRGSARR